MKAATLFSGIGAPEQAMPDWQWLWHAEIERFPADVMAARHPGSVNLGDVLADDFAERAEHVGRPDIIVFGTPCQSFSIAGNRLGLSDPRGSLALAAIALVHRLRPIWFVFENVRGLLSNNEGRDFAAFLKTVAECRYSCCWRVLDAQHWRLAQRRSRVFLVGYIGDWRGPAAVLSLGEGLRGYPETRREKGEEVARPIAAGSPGGSGYRNDTDTENLIIAFNARHPIDTCGYSQAFAFAENSRAEVRLEGGDGQTFGALKAGGGKPGQSYPVVMQGMQVRRLTPMECERLQGFPDRHTAITYRGKPAADGPRYRAIGNSMAVPVVRWLLTRIEQHQNFRQEIP